MENPYEKELLCTQDNPNTRRAALKKYLFSAWSQMNETTKNIPIKSGLVTVIWK